jgi:DNA-3-methyladenine glycosylase II
MAAPIKTRTSLVETEADIRAGVRAIRRKCPHLRRAHDLTGDPPLRRFAPGFESLARIVVGQQVSAASASAIWHRARSAVDPFEPEVLLAKSLAELQGAGLSRPKIRTLLATAEAITEGRLDLAGLITAPDEDVRASLTAVRGIGPWTADIYVMFCLGRADSWAPGDLALQLATQSLLTLDTRPGAEALTKIAERWRPWRGVAARLLWAYYSEARAQQRSPAARAASKSDKHAKSKR